MFECDLLVRHWASRLWASSEQLVAIVKDDSGSSTLALSCREVFARGGRTIEVSGPHVGEQAATV